MKPNKSIDGLTTRDAKTARSSEPSLKTKAEKAKKVKISPSEIKPQKAVKVQKATSSLDSFTSSESPLDIESLNIEVKDDLNFKEATIDEILSDSAPESKDPEKTKESSPEASLAEFLAPTETLDKISEKDKNMSKNPEKPEKTSKTQPKPAKKTEKSKKKPGKARKIISIIALIIVLALIGLVSWAVFWGNDIIAKITGGQGNLLDALTFIDETYDPLKTDENGRTNILAFGTSGYDMSGDEGDGVHDGAQLTDSIMAISLNQETGDIVMISLPRDLKASPTCTATGKINEVYWCNNMYDDDEEAGATALMEEVSDILGIDFQYYAHLNWGSLVSIVDTLGGIKVTLDEDIDDDWWTGAVYEAGVEYYLNGEEALGLARARHGTAAGDFSRGASQQKILIGIKDKVFEKELSITDMLSLASALGDNFRSNFTLPELKTLAHLTFEFDFDSMRQVSLLDYAHDIHLMTMGTLENGISYVFPSAGVGNYSDIQEYVLEQLLWTPPEDEPEEETTEEELEPADD